MDEVSIVGIDLANQVFQVHGAAAGGRVLFRKKKLSRPQFAKFMAACPHASWRWRAAEPHIIGVGNCPGTAMTSGSSHRST